ncbi:MAG: baseplate J/gp47 family protein [Candidatus Improbicoccus devescovinae]|nr:MAG: baseplate J/gp47 family protein [Candidatus Improbicoccus devescovinae]
MGLDVNFVNFLPKIDNRNYQDLLRDFKFLAQRYTPEWNFDVNSDDFGVTISKMFCELMETNINKLNKTLDNYHATFLNIIGTYPMAPQSARGYIQVVAVKNSSGSYVKSGTKVRSVAEDGDDIFFETIEDLFVFDTKINSIFFADSLQKNGSIVKAYDCENKFEPIRICDFSSFDNINIRRMYFEDNILFDTSVTEIIFYFHNKNSAKTERKLAEIFSSPNSIWEYHDGVQWQRIYDVSLENPENGNHIRLFFNAKSEITTVMGVKSRFVRCSPDVVDSIPITDVSYSIKSKIIDPDIIIVNDEEVEKNNFLPFGEKTLIYDIFYVKSDEAFSKKNSKIELFLDIKFIKLKSAQNKGAQNFKSIMSDLDFAEIEPADVSIDQVDWEYWNGLGWAKIKCEIKHDAKKIFEISEKSVKRKLSFSCPEDLKKITVGAYEGLFVRCKILKLNNVYEMEVNYICPIIENLNIRYSYDDKLIKFNKILTESQAKQEIISLIGNNNSISFLENIKDPDPVIYFCFDKPIDKGIFRIFFEIEDGYGKKNGFTFKWEYLTSNVENKLQWCHANTTDFTDGLYHSDIISIFGSKNMAKTVLYGSEGYFLRAINIGGELRNVPEYKRPLITDIKLNVVQVVQELTQEAEYFSISRGEKKKVCKLTNKGLSQVTVWVDELEILSTDEVQKILSDDYINISVVPEYNEFKVCKHIWVKWSAVKNLKTEGPKSRVYQVNLVESSIKFGDNAHGMIPPTRYTDTIKIEYKTCKGRKGNIQTDSIEGFDSFVKNISKVSNFRAFTDGANIESIPEASKRMFSRLCGAERIISNSDFEQSLLSNDSNIHKIKCLAHIDRFSNKSVGEICISVLPKIIQCGYERFSGIRKKILNFIKENASIGFQKNLKLSIFEVIYIETQVKMKVYIESFEFYQYVYTSLENKLKEFLNPITGGFSRTGWDIGSIVNKNSIKNYLISIEHVTRIQDIFLNMQIISEEGKQDITAEKLKTMKFIVPLFGGMDADLKI